MIVPGLSSGVGVSNNVLWKESRPTWGLEEA